MVMMFFDKNVSPKDKPSVRHFILKFYNVLGKYWGRKGVTCGQTSGCCIKTTHWLALQYQWGSSWCKNGSSWWNSVPSLLICLCVAAFFSYKKYNRVQKWDEFWPLKEVQLCTSHALKAISDDVFQKCFQRIASWMVTKRNWVLWKGWWQLTGELSFSLQSNSWNFLATHFKSLEIILTLLITAVISCLAVGWFWCWPFLLCNIKTVSYLSAHSWKLYTHMFYVECCKGRMLINFNWSSPV
jgi:hypothetical protein